MRIFISVRAILGAAITLTGIRLLVSGVSLEVPEPLFANGTCSDWTAWMPPRTDPAIIMQVVTKGYIPVQKNFISLMETNSRFSRDNIFLVCLDDESEASIALMGFSCVPMADDLKGRKLAKIWQLRIKILSCLLKAGHDVIASDSDALWLNDPFLDFDLPEVRGSSVVSSRGDMPKNLYKLWGSILCMGFIIFRPGAGVENLLVKMEKLVMKIEDDQIVTNFVLKQLGIEWDPTTDMRYVNSTGFGRGTVPATDPEGADSFNVTLLPHNRYTRRCDEVQIGSKTTVAHCHGVKQGSSKIAWIKREHMWVVDDLTGEGQY